MAWIGGDQATDPLLPRFSEANREANITACAFLGDECSTLQMTADIQELNTRYYEPLAKVGAGRNLNTQSMLVLGALWNL